jgi:glycosyltransferase involved in cell wall biosynthesis
MTRPPLISVLMPVFNAECYVAEAVESILCQTFEDFEFLIVDDGSTDGSRAILERFAARDTRVHLVSQPNTGYLVALNEMIGRSHGELLARMDADDVSLPGRFERQVAYLEEHPECVMVGSRVQIIDPDGMPLTVMGDALAHEQIVDGFLAGAGQLIYHPSVVIRRRALDQIGLYRDEYYLSEDLDLFLRLAEVGRIVNLPEPLLKYREHLAKVGRERAVQQKLNSRKAILEAHRRRGLPPPLNPHAGAGRTTGLDEVKPFVEAEVYRTWAWWAVMSGNVASARKHAIACLARTPFDLASWKLLYCAIRGR